MNLAWFIPGVVLLAVGGLSIAPVAHFLGNKPTLRFLANIGVVVSIIYGGIIAVSAANEQTAGGIVLFSVVGIVFLEALVFERLKKRKAQAPASEKADAKSSEDSFEDGEVPELPEEYRLRVGLHITVFDDPRNFFGEVVCLTPDEVVLYDPKRTSEGVVVLPRLGLKYGPKSD